MLAFSTYFLLLSTAHAQTPSCDADLGPWPTTDWAASRNMPPPDAIAAVEAYAFTLTGDNAERLGVRTDSVVVIQHGEVVWERYARGYSADKLHLGWSMTKSLNNAILGAAVQRGLIDLDRPICDYTDKASTENCDITSRHLTQMASGLDWAETYEGEGNQASSVLAMLYGLGSQDAAAFVGHHAKANAAGQVFRYSTGDQVLLAAALGGAGQPTLGEDYPWELIFTPLGITHTTYERDLAGTYLGGSYWYARPRDMARLGYLYLHDGCWAGQRVLPEGWVAQATTPTEAAKHQEPHGDDHDAPGWSWWTNVDVPESGQTAIMPHAPADTYYAAGNWGQFVYVVPSLDAIVVRTGDDRDGSYEHDAFLPLALALLEAP